MKSSFAVNVALVTNMVLLLVSVGPDQPTGFDLTSDPEVDDTRR